MSDMLVVPRQDFFAPSSQPSTVDDRWYVVRTQYHKADRAELNLAAAGFTTFMPRIRAKTATRTPQTVPLFPQYLFARFNAVKSLRLVTFMTGVSYVVTFAGEPASVDDEVIELLRSRMEADGCIRVGERLYPGDQVYIKSGPFAAMLGVVERNLSAKERVLVLLSTISASVRVELPREAVQRCT